MADTTASTVGNDEEELKALVARVEAFLGKTASGYDTDGRDYDSVLELWAEAGILAPPSAAAQKQAAATEGEDPAWYSHAFAYWETEENCPPTVDGVLGGFGHVSGTDVAGSRRFLEARVKPLIPALRFLRAVDVGAGIGRVTKHLLLPMFEHVDLLEQSPRLLAAAPDFIFGPQGAATTTADTTGTRTKATEAVKDASPSPSTKRLQPSERVTYLCAGMQDFAPAPGTVYDVVWIQWCIGHLHDLDLIRFLGRVKAALRLHSGVVVVKDNCCDGSDFVVDTQDSSLTRSVVYLKALFQLAGFELRVEEKQEGFPNELFPVFMFCFTAKEEGTAAT